MVDEEQSGFQVFMTQAEYIHFNLETSTKTNSMPTSNDSLVVAQGFVSQFCFMDPVT